MKLIEFNFNSIPVMGLSIFVEDKEVACGFIGDVLKKIPHLKDYEISETNFFFDIFVIRLKEPVKNEERLGGYKIMNRQLSDVINDMLKEIPETEEVLISELKNHLNSITYTAPEIMYMRWDHVHSSLITNLPQIPTEEWQFKVLSIFSTKSVDELKRLFAIIKEGNNK